MIRHTRFEVLTAVVMNSPVFWDVTVKVNRRFGGTYLQGGKVSKARNQHKTGAKQSSRWDF
jgi:hypothetical protein